MCLTCITIPAAGADVNVSTFSRTLYALVADCVFGYWVTPSKLTKISSLEGGALERVNVVVLPLPVKWSTVLSTASKLGATSPINEPNALSVDAGAVLNTIVESVSIPKPSLGLVESTGLWLTPLTESNNCEARLIFALFPSPCVALNLVLIPSNAIFNVCALPTPTPVRLIAVPAIALEELVANFIVLWSILIT